MTRAGWAAAGVIAAGWALRLRLFFEHRSVSWFEAALAINIVQRPIAALTAPLDNHESAPLGFLVLTRLLVRLFGDGEFVLRLVPLACGLIALPLFYRCATRWLVPWMAVAATALVAVSQAQVLWSATCKPYSMDLVVTLLLLEVAEPLVGAAESSAWITVATVGAVAVWWSLPAVFVLAGIGTAAAFHVWRQDDRRRLLPLVGVGVVWTASFGASYALSMRAREADAFLHRIWNAYFLSLRDLTQTRDLLAATFADPYGLSIGHAWPLVPIVGAGAIALWLRRRERAVLFLAPLVFTAAASFAGLYPWADRLLLFATPMVLVLLFAGASQIGEWIGVVLPRARIAATVMLVVLLLAGATANALAEPITEDQIRPLVAYLGDHIRPGDRIYAAEFTAAYDYYRPRFGLANVPYTSGPYFDDEPSSDCSIARSLRWESRLWVLTGRRDVRQCVMAFGTPADVVNGVDATLYLFARR
jgi:hypothetical protein